MLLLNAGACGSHQSGFGSGSWNWQKVMYVKICLHPAANIGRLQPIERACLRIKKWEFAGSLITWRTPKADPGECSQKKNIVRGRGMQPESIIWLTYKADAGEYSQKNIIWPTPKADAGECSQKKHCIWPTPKADAGECSQKASYGLPLRRTPRNTARKYHTAYP